MCPGVPPVTHGNPVFNVTMLEVWLIPPDEVCRNADLWKVARERSKQALVPLTI